MRQLKRSLAAMVTVLVIAACEPGLDQRQAAPSGQAQRATTPRTAGDPSMTSARQATGGFALANIALSTAQPDRMANWYRDALGFEIKNQAPGVQGVTTFIIERDGVSIDLIRVPNQRPLETPLPPPDFLRIQGLRNLVFWVDDQRAANEHLKGLGVPLLWESLEVEGIGTAITAFRDPDGNLIALWERRPSARQGTGAR